MASRVQSGVTDCACCGMHIMVNNVNRDNYCEGCRPARKREAGECNPKKSWHCATGECDGTLCDENGNHETPKPTTHELIMADVARAERTDTPIYDGTAKGIAAGWQSARNMGFTAFNSTGTITDDLDMEIQSEKSYVSRHPEHFDADESIKDLGTADQNIRMLDALLTYVRKYGNRGVMSRWDRVAPDVLTEDMEYNTDDDEI